MECKYALSRTDRSDRMCFGITVMNDKNQLIAEVHDISEDEAKITQLVQLCNSLKLSDVHILDVIDDFIG